MLATCSLTTTLQAKYRDYIDKINLTEEAKTRSYQLLNELGLIDLIYSSTNHQNKQAIEEKLGQIDKVIEGKLKSQGWMTYFTKVSEVVSLEEVWRVISTFQNDPRQNLINDICQLKLNIDKQSELAASNK